MTRNEHKIHFIHLYREKDQEIKKESFVRETLYGKNFIKDIFLISVVVPKVVVC